MKTNIKIAVIGGTGKSGKYLVSALLKQGYSVHLLFRNPESLPMHHDLITPIRGDARDEKAVSTLLKGCQAVVSTLGQPKGEPPVFSQATGHVLRAMHDHRIQRYILTTGLNVDTPFDQKGDKTKYATDWMKTNFPKTTADKQKEYQILSDSLVNWTLVRLPWIELTDTRSRTEVSLKDCPGETISATDLAYFLVDQLSEDEYIRKAPFIANV